MLLQYPPGITPTSQSGSPGNGKASELEFNQLSPLYIYRENLTGPDIATTLEAFDAIPSFVLSGGRRGTHTLVFHTVCEYSAAPNVSVTAYAAREIFAVVQNLGSARRPNDGPRLQDALSTTTNLNTTSLRTGNILMPSYWVVAAVFRMTSNIHTGLATDSMGVSASAALPIAANPELPAGEYKIVWTNTLTSLIYVGNTHLILQHTL